MPNFELRVSRKLTYDKVSVEAKTATEAKEKMSKELNNINYCPSKVVRVDTLNIDIVSSDA